MPCEHTDIPTTTVSSISKTYRCVGSLYVSYGLPVANKLVSGQVEVFIARMTTDSVYYTDACDAVESGLFRGVNVVEAGP